MLKLILWLGRLLLKMDRYYRQDITNFSADIMQNETFKSQFDNVHMLCFHTANPGATIFKDKVTSMKAIQGKPMRAMNTYGATWIEALGGTPVSISSNDGYENISKNVIDGGFWFFDQIESNALYEVISTVIYSSVSETAPMMLFRMI